MLFTPLSAPLTNGSPPSSVLHTSLYLELQKTLIGQRPIRTSARILKTSPRRVVNDHSRNENTQPRSRKRDVYPWDTSYNNMFPTTSASHIH